jgi:hypothetical protein
MLESMTMQNVLKVAIVLGIGAISLPGPSLAAESWKPDPPGKWRKLTWDEKTTTSKCIGKSVSPICAVENKLACYMQKKEELCHLAIRDHEGRTFVRSEPSYPLYTAYRISAIREVKSGETITVLKETAEPGDYVVDLRDRSCEVKSGRCENDIGPATTHLVRKIGDEWRIITWDTPRW